MKVTTAVITAAGLGTRMMPLTSAVQKVMLPILSRPVIDYIVADCIAAGATNIIFVTNPGSRELQDFYLGNQALDDLLGHFGKTEALADLEKLRGQAKFTFLEQKFDKDGYGTNPPLLLAAPHIPAGEAFIFTYGDAWLKRADGRSEYQHLVEAFQQAGADGAITGLEMPVNDIVRYGCLAIREHGGHEYLSGIVEKPAPDKAPSNLASLGFYVFTPKILPYAEAVQSNEMGEFYLTDAVEAAARDLPIVIHRATGKFLDAGNLPSWLDANLTLAKDDPNLSQILKNHSIS